MGRSRDWFPDRTMCPEVDSTSESEYQGFLRGKGGRCFWLTTYQPCSAETSRKSGLNLPGTPWATSACRGRLLLRPFTRKNLSLIFTVFTTNITWTVLESNPVSVINSWRLKSVKVIQKPSSLSLQEQWLYYWKEKCICCWEATKTCTVCAEGGGVC